MKKTTDELIDALHSTSSFKSFKDANQDSFLDVTLAEHLLQVMDAKNVKKSQAIHDGNLNEVYGYQILKGQRIPSRDKLLCLCIGATFTEAEISTCLKVAGYAQLYPKDMRDSIILYGIIHGQNLMEINQALYENELETLN